MGDVRKLDERLLEFRAERARTSDEAFLRFMDEAEREYRRMPKDFVLIFDLSDYGGVSVHQAMLWMQLFERVRSVTETNLVCTCVCAPSPIVLAGVRLFTTLYSAVKPFHVFEDRVACVDAARRALQNSPP